MGKTTFRSAIFQVHLWAGLSLGTYAFLIGLTGSVLMFREAIVEQISPTPAIAEGERLSMEEIRNRIQSSYPDWDAWSFEMPREPGHPWSSYLLGKGRGKLVFADHQGRIVGERDLHHTWFGLFERFHSNLLLPRGRLINGIFGLAVAVLALTGAVLWWPAKGAWSSAFRIVRTNNWKGVVYDLHRVGGAVSLLFIVMFCITGAYFTWPAVFRSAVATVLPMQKKAQPPRLDTAGPRKRVDELVAAARAAVPDGTPLRILIAKNPKNPVQVMLQHGSERDISTVALDGHTGEVVDVQAFGADLAGDRAVRFIPALHVGSFGGSAIRVLWAIAGLAMPALFITGFLMWCNRVVAPRIRSRRVEQPVGA